MTNSLVGYDIIAVSAAYFLALLLRFDFRFSMIPGQYFDAWLDFAPFYAVFCIFFGPAFGKKLRAVSNDLDGGAVIFGYYVDDPRPFGV